MHIVRRIPAARLPPHIHPRSVSKSQQPELTLGSSWTSQHDGGYIHPQSDMSSMRGCVTWVLSRQFSLRHLYVFTLPFFFQGVSCFS